MYLHQNELTIRDALPADTPLLCRWWNDGKVMEHAGFPQGLGTSIEKITQQLLEPNNRTHLLIIESEGLPIGEMNWRRAETDRAEIGIKICDPSVVCDEGVVNAMIECCEKNQIKYQREVIDQGGTDASSMNLSGVGVKAGGIVVVTRYPHSQSAVASKKDIEGGVDLINAFSKYTFS